jgi:hypothetical protein
MGVGEGAWSQWSAHSGKLIDGRHGAGSFLRSWQLLTFPALYGAQGFSAVLTRACQLNPKTIPWVVPRNLSQSKAGVTFRGFADFWAVRSCEPHVQPPQQADVEATLYLGAGRFESLPGNRLS